MIADDHNLADYGISENVRIAYVAINVGSGALSESALCMTLRFRFRVRVRVVVGLYCVIIILCTKHWSG